MQNLPKLQKVIPDSLRDERRFALTADRHRNAFAWTPQDWIPLGIIINDPAYLEGISYDRWTDPAAFYEPAARQLRDTLAVGSDYMPVLALNHLGDVLIPTMFGAELFVPTAMARSVQDTGATPYPVWKEIREIDDVAWPGMDAGRMPCFLDIIRAWRRWAPPWVHIVTPFPLGPFSLAAELRGSGFLFDIVDDPERSRRLLAHCAEMQVHTERHLCAAVGNGNDPPISNFGISGPGRRMGDDQIINLSPQTIAEYAVPYIEQIARKLGPATVHFCTLAQRRADHVFEPLARSDWIRVASSQFAFEYYEENLDALRGRLAIEALYGDAYRYLCETHGSFRDWAFEFVPRFKNESGLVLYFEAPSLEAGRELWATWQEAHQLGAGTGQSPQRT